jgi:hypothetical protein
MERRIFACQVNDLASLLARYTSPAIVEHCLSLFTTPELAGRRLKPVKFALFDIATVACRRGADVVAIICDLGRRLECIVQVIRVLEYALLPTYADKVDIANMRAQFDHPGSTRVWHYRNGEFGRQKEDREYLVDTTETASIQLHRIQRFGLQQLLEHNSVVDVFACSNTHTIWLEGSTNARVPEDIIRRCWLLNEPDWSA